MYLCVMEVIKIFLLGLLTIIVIVGLGYVVINTSIVLGLILVGLIFFSPVIFAVGLLVYIIFIRGRS
jgi:hypothetical protein